jgi:hypothetical protein
VVAGERYAAATVDDNQQLHITTADHRELVPAKENDQEGFESPVISPGSKNSRIDFKPALCP